MSFIEFKNVSKIYQMGEVEIRALDNISFDIDKGQSRGYHALLTWLSCTDIMHWSRG